MRTRFLALPAVLLFLCAAAASAQTNSSVYTNLDGPKCITLHASDEGTGSYEGRCPGIGGYKLLVQEGDIRQNLVVVTPAGKKHSLELWNVVGAGFSNLGPRAEWRVRGRSMRPDALIVRYNVANPEDSTKGTSWLVVVKITPGGICVTDKIAPGPNQNEQARTAADASAAKPCLKAGN